MGIHSAAFEEWRIADAPEAVWRTVAVDATAATQRIALRMTVTRRGFLGMLGSGVAATMSPPTRKRMTVKERLHLAADRIRWNQKVYRTAAGGTSITLIATLNNNTTT